MDSPTADRSLFAAFAAPAVLLGFLFIVVWSVFSNPQAPPRPEATRALGTLVDPAEAYDPVRAGEPLPDGFRQLLRRDGILPIYDPTFLPGSTSDWSPETMVLALEIGGEAKAYPVGLLNTREMVVDRLAGIPVLVTW